MKSIKVFAPATVANVTCGYDILGFAVHEPGDEVILKLTNSGEIKIKEISGDGGVLPKSVERNTVSVSIKSFLDHLDVKPWGRHLFTKKNAIGKWARVKCSQCSGRSIWTKFLAG